MMMANDGPLVTAFNDDKEGVVRKELITYRMVNGQLQKEVVTRDYFGNDYHDSINTIPLRARTGKTE